MLIFVRESFKNIKRYSYSSIDSILIIMLTIFLLGIIGIIIFNAQRFVNVLKERVEIIAFLDDRAGKNNINELKRKITALDNVDKITYVSKEEALKYLTKDKDLNRQIKLIGNNPLPASFSIHVKTNDIDSIRVTAKSISKLPFIDDVRYGEKNMRNLTRILHYINVLGILFGLFAFIFIFILLKNVAKVSSYERRKEITLFPLLGATQGFTRLLFACEGALIGLVSLIIALALLFGVYATLVSKITALRFMPIVYLIVLFFIAMILGVSSRIFILKKWIHRL